MSVRIPNITSLAGQRERRESQRIGLCVPGTNILTYCTIRGRGEVVEGGGGEYEEKGGGKRLREGKYNVNRLFYSKNEKC